MKNILLLLAFIMVTGTFVRSQTVGESAPDFTYDKHDGGSFTLSEQLGKIVLIYVFGYNCHFCIISGKVVQAELISKYENEEKLVVVGVDIWDGSVSGVENFKEDTGLEIPLLLMAGSFSSSYNTARDRLIAVDQTGNIIFKDNSTADNAVDKVIPVLDNAIQSIPTALNNKKKEVSDLTFSPNPVVDQSVLDFNLDKNGTVSIVVRSLDGRIIKHVINEYLTEGAHSIAIDMADIQSGMYVTHISTNTENQLVQFIKN